MAKKKKKNQVLVVPPLSLPSLKLNEQCLSLATCSWSFYRTVERGVIARTERFPQAGRARSRGSGRKSWVKREWKQVVTQSSASSLDSRTSNPTSKPNWWSHKKGWITVCCRQTADVSELQSAKGLLSFFFPLPFGRCTGLPDLTSQTRNWTWALAIQRKLRILTTRPPRNSPEMPFLFCFPISCLGDLYPSYPQQTVQGTWVTD